MKRSAAILLAILLGILAVGVAAPAHGGANCGMRWGSLPKALNTGSTGEILQVRAGRHACFDRMVFDVSGAASGYFVRYVDEVRMDGSGQVVPLRGGARLAVTATAPAIATDAWFRPNGELIDTTGYRTFRHVAWAGGHEAQTTIGLGVRARLPFHVSLLDGPGSGSRMVVDVAHTW